MAVTMMARCDACGLPPRPNQKRLLKCTRCKHAQYHDRHCQQNHYPKHKAECRRLARAAAARKTGTGSPATADAPTRKPLVQCRSIEGRGRSLVATSPLTVGCRPLPTRDDGLCGPIAHPVLIESMRRSRCAFCFRPICDPPAPDPDAPSFHFHCSAECRALDENWTIEARAAARLPSPPSPTALSCSRLLRKFRSSPSASDEYDRLCWNVDSLSREEEESHVSIMSQCHAFLVAMGDSETAGIANDLLRPDPTPAHRFMSRLGMNGFSISDSEQLPLGHGVYCGASLINHSCRPNAVPTFWLRDGSPPMLQITVCRPVSPGDEVTISYCDVTTPRGMRTDSLWKNYKFNCDCALCNDAERDDDVVGLKCPTEGCKGRVISIAAPNESDVSVTEWAPSGRDDAKELKYQCGSCGNTNFIDARKAQADSMKKIKALESKMNSCSDSRRFHEKSGAKARQLFESLKRHCDLRTSYYVAWSADLFVHLCANAFKSYAEEREQMDLCRQALFVMNESRPATKFCVEYPGSLCWHVKQGLEAKLRLFANPADMEALVMLGKVRKELLLYYPSSDDTIRSLDESLAAYHFT